jgi:hypothetical protein
MTQNATPKTVLPLLNDWRTATQIYGLLGGCRACISHSLLRLYEAEKIDRKLEKGEWWWKRKSNPVKSS